MDYHKRSYGRFHGRVHLQGSSPLDASLVISDLTLEDYGRYKCEVIDGLEDGTSVVSLDLQGKHLPSCVYVYRWEGFIKVGVGEGGGAGAAPLSERLPLQLTGHPSSSRASVPD